MKTFLTILASIAAWTVIGGLVFASLFGVGVYVFTPKQYTASAQVYVRNIKDEYASNSTTTGNLTAAQQLAANYAVHMKTQPVLEAAADKLEGRISVTQLKKACAAASVDDTSWVKVSVTLADPELAIEACNALAQASAETFGELEASSATARDLADEATREMPNVLPTALLGAAIGILAGLPLGGITALIIVLVTRKRSKRTAA